MANYADRDGVILAAGGIKRLVQIADFDGDGEEDAGVVVDALDEAEGIMNSYIRKKFEVPIAAPIPESIKRLAANLAVWVLKARRDALTEGDLLKHEGYIRWLEGLAKGKNDPGINPRPAASPHNRPSTTDRPSSKAVSREKLKGFA